MSTRITVIVILCISLFCSIATGFVIFDEDVNFTMSKNIAATVVEANVVQTQSGFIKYIINCEYGNEGLVLNVNDCAYAGVNSGDKIELIKTVNVGEGKISTLYSLPN